MAAAQGGKTTKESTQDLIISVVIAFALAFVFRGFVVEAFVIPTGSMAPTLMGAHERFRGKETGYTWAVGPWDWDPRSPQSYYPRQGTAQRPVRVHDPMSGQVDSRVGMPRLSGDRILVLKYLYSVLGPERFDVVVFKFKEPVQSEVNYIKRLTGLPGEEIAIVDGDVFFRKHEDKPVASGDPDNRWAEAGWQVARKPVHVQAAMWQKVFDSDFAPRSSTTAGKVRTTPWTSQQPGWNLGGQVYEYAGRGATELVWDSTLLRFDDRTIDFKDTWAIDDRYPYDETPVPYKPLGHPGTRYPVSDLRMGAGIEPTGPGLVARATMVARGHLFQMELTEQAAVLRMRPQGSDAPWHEVGRAEVHALSPGRVANVRFVHADQTLEAWVDGTRVARHAYEWSPAERIAFATGKSVAELREAEKPGALSIYGDPTIYASARISWSFDGAGVKLHRVSLDRDIFYQPAGPMGSTARGSRPEAPMVLNDDQFFVCGDNSPQSLDARLWNAPEPFVREIDPTEGVVPRKLMLGKAFFVYFPALHEEATLPVPDFGRMRFIW
jgi:signal peptidase I